MKTYFGYTRVSTVKQGEQGVSLQEQRVAIETYAVRHELTISQWFEERETAAKRGRPVFDRMMSLLRQEKAAGVVIHKIDRSARNLRDWSDLGDVMDSGIEVHFANESLDLNSRGGRLSADIQAVVAADYIRNLRDETIKGMRGRYRQGLLPLPAPIGYLDQGGGQPKRIDPPQGPLVRRAFELYASARYGHHELADIMYDLGLRTKRGQRVGKSTFAWILANPFYYGLIRLKSTGQLFEGRHQPLISHTLFNAAREVAAQRLNKRAVKHDFTFRRSVRCGVCGYNLTGERVKGIIYYRCHTNTCPANAIRDDRLKTIVLGTLSRLEMPEREHRFLLAVLKDITVEALQQRSEVIHAMKAALGSVQERTSRLADAYLDGILNREVLQDKQKALLEERKGIEDRLKLAEQRNDLMSEKLREFLDFAVSVKTVFEKSTPSFQQQLLRRVASRVTVTNKVAAVVLHKPYELFASRPSFQTTARNGVGPLGLPPLNSGGISGDAMDIGLSSSDRSIASVDDRNGCPPQTGLRTLLLDIGRELVSNPE